MFARNIKVVILLAIFLILALFLVINTKTICNDKYWEEVKTKKQIGNIETCIKEGNVDAAVLLSDMYARGDTVERNHSKAVEIIKEWAESGNSKAMVQIADLYSCYNEYNNFNEAEEWYKKAINVGDDYSEKAKMGLTRFYIRKYSHTKKPQYIDLYINWLKKIADEGNVDAIHLLASEYMEGKYLSRDYYISLDWLKKAAAKGDVLAYRSIGNYYANGFFGDADYKEAEHWFQEAVKRGDDVSANFLKSNPNPLELEITKATISDFKKKFKKHKEMTSSNSINGGCAYLVSPEYIPLDGLKDDVVFVFDKNSILESVLMVFDKSKYREIQSHLKSKYTPLIEGSQNFFTHSLTEIELIDEYIFYSTFLTPTYKLGVCTLIYKSRAFSVKLFERDQFLRERSEEAKRQKMNLL